MIGLEQIINYIAISFSCSNNAIVKNNSIIDSTDASVSGIIGGSSALIELYYINIYATEENSAVSGVTVSEFYYY